jgi:hypothetical protein
VRNVQRGAAAIRGKVKAVLGSPRIHAATKQFVGGIVDVLGERVVRPEIQSLGEPVHEVDRSGMISSRAYRRVFGEIDEKPLCGQRLEQVVRKEALEIGQCGRGCRDTVAGIADALR